MLCQTTILEYFLFVIAKYDTISFYLLRIINLHNKLHHSLLNKSWHIHYHNLNPRNSRRSLNSNRLNHHNRCHLHHRIPHTTLRYLEKALSVRTINAKVAHQLQKRKTESGQENFDPMEFFTQFQ